MQQIASFVAPVATTLAALIVASNLGARITGFGFIVFVVGSVSWSVVGLATDQPNLLWQNVVLTALNLFGVWRWLGWQARIEEGAETAAKESEAESGETLFPVSLLMKGRVISEDGDEVGRCVDAMAGCRSGRLTYLVVAEGGVAGVGQKLRRLSWSGCSVDEERVLAPIASARFCALEPLEADHWPAH